MKRTCAKAGCSRDRTPYGRYCRTCATAATRRWRSQHCFEVQAREQLRVFTEEQRALRNARSYGAVYVKRGKLRPGDCEICGDREVSPHWDDPRQPLTVRWLCPAHRREHLDVRREVAEGKAALLQQFVQLRAALAALPAEERRTLETRGRAGIDGTGAEPGSLRYWLALRQAYAEHVAPKRQGDFWT